jgi:hypothetical protein
MTTSGRSDVAVGQRDVPQINVFRLLAEGVGDLVFYSLEVSIVDVSEKPEGEHVLALARVLIDGEALLLHRDFDDAVVARPELDEGLLPGALNVRIRVRRPKILDENDRVVGQRAEPMPRQQHLFVERDDQLHLIAPVRDGARPDADAIAARPFRGSRRRLDLGGDDLHRPDAVAHLGRHRAEDLAALLCAFAGIGDDFERVLRETQNGR